MNGDLLVYGLLEKRRDNKKWVQCIQILFAPLTENCVLLAILFPSVRPNEGAKIVVLDLLFISGAHVNDIDTDREKQPRTFG